MNPCMYPKCKSFRYSRGLCVQHYTTAMAEQWGSLAIEQKAAA